MFYNEYRFDEIIFFQMPNIHMSQSQSMSMQGGLGGMAGMGSMGGHQGSPMGGHQGSPMGAGALHQPTLLNQNGTQSFPSLHNASSFSGQAADFNLDFLDNIPSTDAGDLTARELLDSLDDNSFLNDIL